MERFINQKSADIWRPEEFAHTFGFEKCEEGFAKEVAGTNYNFREISTADELKKVVEVQKKAWDWEDRELAPVHILALMPDTGGGVFGAYNEKGEVVGFAGGFGGGVDKITGKPILISSMLAISDKDLRGNGLGRELKIVQAYNAYRNGYNSMKWLYDPERGGNASLNIAKLGAMAEEFYVDKYGEMRSGLYGSIVPTDRFRAVWRYTEPQTIDRIIGVSDKSVSVDDMPIATETYLPDSDKVAVEISSDIDKIPEDEKIKRRFKLRTILTNYFLEKKYVATNFVSKRTDSERQNYYILEPMEKVIEQGRITV